MSPVTFGVDVARSGSDESVIASNDAGRIRVVHTAQGADTMATTGALLRVLAEAGPGATAAVDVIGIGSGVFDRAREQGAPVRAFNSSERARDPKRFRNSRAEGFWRLREELRAGRIDLDPADEDLAAQLLAIRWSIDSSGRIVIESKEAMKARGVSSPDRADAAMMSLAPPENSTRWISTGIRQRSPILDRLEVVGTGDRLGGEDWRANFIGRDW